MGVLLVSLTCIIVSACIAVIVMTVMAGRLDGRRWVHVDWEIRKLDMTLVASGTSRRRIRLDDMNAEAGDILLEWFYYQSTADGVRNSFCCGIKLKDGNQWLGLAFGA
jgi:hypothetical protein